MIISKIVKLGESELLEIKRFSKKYKGSKQYSAHNINLKVEDGKILGLLGNNGAGKSTIIKSVVGVLPISEGQIVVNGFDMANNPVSAKRTLGYVPDDHAVYEKLTGREYVNFMGNLYNVPKQLKQERLTYYANLFKISDDLDNQISNYSHGMKQKICLIGSLIHQPKLWVLDEPMIGLDPTSMAELKACIIDYAQKGNTVLFSSHNLDVVEKLCDDVAIIAKGKLVAYFNIKEVKKNSEFDLEKLFNQLNKGKQ